MANAKRTRNLFDPASSQPFKLSRSKIELFLECPRCFYLDRRLGIGRPGFPPYTLNSAVDALLKKEFDLHRAAGKAHPLMETYGIDAIPLAHDNMNEWRNNFVGVQYHHQPTNFIVFGAVDDIWQDKEGNLMVVDYKSTSTSAEITLDNEYRQAYKRQMEIYQWLLRNNGHNVSDKGYFVYANADKNKSAFEGKLHFDVMILEYSGSDKWIENALMRAHECLVSDEVPDQNPNCEYCNYRKAAFEHEPKL